VISHGIMQDTPMKRALKTLEAYHAPTRPPTETLAQTFSRINSRSAVPLNILDTLWSGIEKHKISSLIYIESITDSEVVLVGRDEMSRNQDSILKVLRINIGKPKATLQLTAKGAKYGIQD